MKLIVSDIILPLGADNNEAISAAKTALGLVNGDILGAEIYKKAFDLRHGRAKAVYSVAVEADISEDAVLPPHVRRAVAAAMPRPTGKRKLQHRPVIVGFGPAGLFATYVLAKQGYNPVVFERGGCMEDRDKAVDVFFAGGALCEQSNIQFGEGGAGAYSDGKLTTRIGDSRCQLVLDILRHHGAPADALIAAKPHIGTDYLKNIVVSMRRAILACGGSVHFNTKVQGFSVQNGALGGVRTENGAFACQTAVLAIGHSARDTFLDLAETGFLLEAKAFSVGVRIEHLQREIDRALYGGYAGNAHLPPGEYALSMREGGRACYSFCMCPGGTVIPVASEQGGLAVNGMSYHARDGENANAALCVSVGPGDFGTGIFDGVAFQRSLERAAFASGGGEYAAPGQRFGDFENNQKSTHLGTVRPSYPREYKLTDINQILPPFVSDMLKTTVRAFGKKLRGFDAPDALLTAVESRTSSPVRILRKQDMESIAVKGVIPCGEGAGYAGGIMSAAVDGIKAAERIMAQYAP